MIASRFKEDDIDFELAGDSKIVKKSSKASDLTDFGDIGHSNQVPKKGKSSKKPVKMI